MQKNRPTRRDRLTSSKKIRVLQACTIILVLAVVVMSASVLLHGRRRKPTETQQTVNSIDNQININSKEVDSSQGQEDRIIALLFLASDYLQAGRYDDAVAQYENVLQLDPNNQQALGGLIICYREKKDVTNSIRYLEQIITLLDSRHPKDQELISHYRALLRDARENKLSLGGTPERTSS